MSKSTKFIYPLTVQSVLYVNYKSTTNGTWQTNYNNYLWNVTNESMNVTNTDNTGTVNVVALVIGIAQQWGYGTAGTITYPIQFTEIAYTAFACDIAASNENIVSVATNPPEINQIVVRPSAAQTITWLVIGKQQWGYLPNASSGTSGTTIDLPYPVTYAIGVISTSVGSGADITTSISINPAGQTLAVARRPTSGNVAWFIIGY